MAGIEILRQDETLILDDMRRADRPLFAARFSDYERRHRDPPATLDDETVILDGIPPRRRGYAMNRANPDDLHQLFAARFSEQQRRRLDAITNDLNLRRSGHQINDGGVRRRLRNGDEEQQRLSSEIWRYLSTENYEKDECGGFCVVCQSEFEEGDKLGKLRCGHSYHATCIHTWLLKKNTCPLCKQTAISELCNQ